MARVLVACERSGVVRTAFRQLGHDAWSADLVPADDGDEHHLLGDVRTHLDEGWDLMIGHPPCDRLSMAGWPGHIQGHWDYEEIVSGAEFFYDLWEAPIPLMCLENPWARNPPAKHLLPEPSQMIRMWDFGAPMEKRTALWLRGLPPLISAFTGGDAMPKWWCKGGRRKDRKVWRAVTPPGLAAAMAEQWEGFLCRRLSA